jgi:uncharacterized iron-regulated membrane protein
MVLTGVFLWWPRGSGGGVVTVRGAPAQRVFWRDLHAVVGAFTAVFILFLAVTGMPWSMFWGDRVQGWVAMQEFGRPAPPAEVTPAFLLGVPRGTSDGHDHGHKAVRSELPWAVQEAAKPQSIGAHGASLGIDDAVTRFMALGVRRPFAVQSPEGPRGAWAATYTPDQVENVRLVYLDQHSGAVLGDAGYADFGAAAKAIEWGIAVHQGQQYGPVNRYLMLAACLAILALAFSSLKMWWKRRPKGRLGIPPEPEHKSAVLAVFAVTALVGVIYPLTGLSLVAALCFDWIARRVQWRRLRN